MSLLRLCGVVTAAVLLWLAIRTRSQRPARRVDNLMLLAVAALLLVSLVPAAVSVPQTLLRLGETPHGRLLTLLVLSSLALWVVLFYGREGRVSESHRLNTLLDALQVELLSLRYAGPMAPLAIVIPAYNEGESIAGVVRAIPNMVCGHPTTVVVVSDGSTDDTAQVASAAGAVVLPLTANRGGGAAIRVGYRYASRLGAKIIVTMDGDGQHDAADLPHLVQPILDDAADMTVGSRGLGGSEHASGLRTLGLHLFNRVLSVLLQMPITDCSSGFRAFNARTITLADTYEDQYHAAETLIRLRRRGARIVEVGVRMKGRTHGQSKKGKDLLYGYRFARAIVRNWFRG